MSRGMPWYLEAKSMGRRQAQMAARAWLMMVTGLGFLMGFALVHFPSKTERATQASPNWLWWLGAALLMAGISIYAAARVLSPPYDAAAASSEVLPLSEGCLGAAPMVCCFAVPLILASIASVDSQYRWRPLFLLVATAVFMSLFSVVGRIDRSRS